MAIPHKIELPEGYLKELRQAVKKNKANAWLYRLLNDIYKAGYLQAVKDYTIKINEEIDAIHSATTSNDHDGEQFQPDSSEHGGGAGTDAADADSRERSAESEPDTTEEPKPS
jgi:hypothetical protein